MLPELDPDYFKIDGREPRELISYTMCLAASLQFGDGSSGSDRSDTPMTWVQFLMADPLFALAVLGDTEGRQLYLEGRLGGADTERLVKDLEKRLAQKRQASAGQRTKPFSGLGRDIDAISDRMEASVEAYLNAIEAKGSNSPKTTKPETALISPSQLAPLSALARSIDVNAAAARELFAASFGERADHPPHTGLFLAFLELMRRVQSHLNGLTERHLDYYYQEVLALRPRPAVPDHGFVCLRISPEVAAVDLSAGTLLTAGNDSAGNPILFRMDQDTRLTTAKATEVSTLFLDAETGPDSAGAVTRSTVSDIVTRTYSVPKLSDAKSPSDPSGIRPFGGRQERGDTIAKRAVCGIRVASRHLQLAGGTRCVTLSIAFNAEPGTETALQSIVSEDTVSASESGLLLRLSTATVPFDLQDFEVTVDSQAATPKLVLTLTLPPGAPAIAAPADQLAALPYLEIVLGTRRVDGKTRHLAAVFSALEIARIDIELSVQNLSDVQLTGLDGPLDQTQPFMPFGVQPQIGAQVLIDCPELENRPLNSFSLRINWANLPRLPGGFQSYFKGYRNPATNASFRVVLNHREPEGWKPIRLRGENSLGAQLFAQSPDGLSSQTDLHVLSLHDHKLSGKFRLALNAPATGFGRDTFSQAVMDSIPQDEKKTEDEGSKEVDLPEKTAASEMIAKGIETVSSLNPLKRSRDDQKTTLPNPPFSPQASALSVSYESRARITTAADGGQDQVTMLLPFGERTQERFPCPFTDLPSVDGELVQGTLFIGIEAATPGDPLSLLMEIGPDAKGAWTHLDTSLEPLLRWRYLGAGGWGATEDASTALAEIFAQEKPLTWRYLRHDGWKGLSEDYLHFDGTLGFLRSGIINITLPRDIADDNPEMPAGKLWISVSDHRSAVTRLGPLRSITAQAVNAVRVSPITQHGAPPRLPKHSIRAVYAGDVARSIQSVSQPIATTGGRGPETMAEFRVRVSERLRHKNRALQASDYEQMALERFSNLSDAKCIQWEAGLVVLVVAATRRPGDFLPPRINSYELMEIAEWLGARSAIGSGALKVQQVQFEPIRASAFIKTNNSARSDVVDRLAAAISRWIAPWREDPDLPLPIGVGELDPHELHEHLQSDPHVERVDGVSLVRFFERAKETAGGDALEQREALLTDSARLEKLDQGESGIVSPSRFDTVFIPWNRHLLRVSGHMGSAGKRAEKAGIGNLRIGDEFRVGSPIGDTLEEGF
ncbi:MAG: hypothetical protein QNJ09_12115 [Paracoccaceae bacterium]|nr:hypothetical protein [Paracoccaceae bacterium]